MSNKTLRILVVIFGLSLCWTLTLLGKKENEYNKQKIQIEGLIHQNDSLYWELFPISNELGRYEIAFEIFKERNPKAAEEYGKIISHETE